MAEGFRRVLGLGQGLLQAGSSHHQVLSQNIVHKMWKTEAKVQQNQACHCTFLRIQVAKNLPISKLRPPTDLQESKMQLHNPHK